MIEYVSNVVAWVVPAMWGFAALYLVWGTEKTAPWQYPFGMGLVSGLMYLALNEIPLWLSPGITPELVKLGILLAAWGVLIEIFVRTIEDYNLGHRFPLAARVFDWLCRPLPSPEDYNAPPSEDVREGAHRPKPRIVMKPAKWLVERFSDEPSSTDHPDDETDERAAESRDDTY